MLLPDPPDNMINELQKMCFQFVWHNKQDRISRKTTVKPVKDGGLNIPNIRKYVTALKLMWIRRLETTTHRWKNVVLRIYPILSDFSKYGPNFLCEISKNNLFWKDTFRAYKVLFKTVTPNTISELLAQPVFFNDAIEINNRPIAQKKMIRNGIYCIRNFVKADGSFLSWTEFNAKYKLNIDFLSYNGWKSAIKAYIRQTQIQVTDDKVDIMAVTLRLICSVHKGTQIYYRALTSDDKLPNCCQKWTEKLNTDISWKHVWLKMHKIQDVKLKWLQMRTIHRILATNVVLKEMGVAGSNLCTFCNENKDSIEHIFWSCVYSGRFWRAFEERVKEVCMNGSNVKLSQMLILFGCQKNIKTDKVFDLMILLGKWYIYKCKVDGCIPLLSVFITHLVKRYKIEEHNARLNSTMFDFTLQWNPYKPLIVDEQ